MWIREGLERPTASGTQTVENKKNVPKACEPRSRIMAQSHDNDQKSFPTIKLI